MIVALLLVLLAVCLTWVLFRDDDSAENLAEPVSGQEPNGRDRKQRDDE
jgi:hypothetical protein